MKHQLLLLVALTALVSCQTGPPGAKAEIQVKETADGIELSCGEGSIKGNGLEGTNIKLSYNDKNTGEYSCKDDSKIFVKFRTCDNCVELDFPSIASLLVGNLVATTVVGVAAYLIASQSRTPHVPSAKKRSDRQNLISNVASGSGDHYQPLKHGQRRDEYDVLKR